MQDADTLPVSKVVSRAVTLVDPDGTEEGIEALLVAFEDDDRPARGLPGLREELRESAAGVDPDGDDPGIHMAAAVAFYLSGSPDAEDDREDVLRRSARLFYGDEVPPAVESWLSAQGVAP